ncbi:inorganic triphosphatase [Actinobacillus porcinus]|uniref:CYTH domain-containing protein n=1 Tax=Actinobacillus porcinus TaxID=51048 RepID=UPI0023574ADE|nr:inorganic triphosphatase [Actinobacillus porcinus]MCI5763061.1 inorganic triphosphatase [Actinobacillus porcinus]MDY5420614.1 inorganic triphosphatase [Actinobacillus porcinus]
MSHEVELKLAVTPVFAETLAQSLTDFHIIEQKGSFLGNTYYDTQDGFFAKQKMGLRVRSENDVFQMTLKTDGKVTGGLHIRPEYNFPLENAIPDVTMLNSLTELELPADLALIPIFSTDFERQSWVIECGKDTEIEIALDRGEIKAKGNAEPICEVEFELKRGELADLLALVENLTLTDGVRLSSASKAKRGYQLAKGELPPLTDWLEKWRSFLAIEQQSSNPQEILTALFNDEQQLIEETLLFGASYFAQDFMRTVERIGAFFNQANYYVEAKKLLHAAVQQRQSDEQMLLALTESNEWLFEKIRDIIRLHSETKDNALAMGKLENLLHQGQYVKRMINLIKLTVE